MPTMYPLASNLSQSLVLSTFIPLMVSPNPMALNTFLTMTMNKFMSSAQTSIFKPGLHIQLPTQYLHLGVY